MTDTFNCSVSATTKLEAYIGRRDDDVFIEIVIENPGDDVASVCLNSQSARTLAQTLNALAQRLQNHLDKKAHEGGVE